jgi:hypothetical protein
MNFKRIAIVAVTVIFIASTALPSASAQDHPCGGKLTLPFGDGDPRNTVFIPKFGEDCHTYNQRLRKLYPPSYSPEEAVKYPFLYGIRNSESDLKRRVDELESRVNELEQQQR